jgi:hypothetical protein
MGDDRYHRRKMAGPQAPEMEIRDPITALCISRNPSGVCGYTTVRSNCRYFVYAQRPEDQVLAALVRKTETIREQLGSAGQVLQPGDDLTTSGPNGSSRSASSTFGRRSLWRWLLHRGQPELSADGHYQLLVKLRSTIVKPRPNFCASSPHIIGDEEVHPRQLERLGERQQLIGIKPDAGPERGLKQVPIGGRGRLP